MVRPQCNAADHGPSRATVFPSKWEEGPGHTPSGSCVPGLWLPPPGPQSTGVPGSEFRSQGRVVMEGSAPGPERSSRKVGVKGGTGHL